MILETERLILRKLEDTDFERMFLMDSDPEVMKYLGKPVTSVEESKEGIRMIQKQYKENGVGRLAVIEKESGLMIGWSGLKLLREPINGHVNTLDLGYRFIPEFWGKGYAMETAKASLDYGFNELGAETIYAYADSGNTGSNYILKKLGFKNTGEFEDSGVLCFWYELKRENYTDK
ncbi:GNAT family N-acetyltransferase [Chryseobacterium lactis]|uniref:N-acetyltransferase n=1 Tax=Chryseobacterium lactis TaxID=1241981 RepID=A0A3G6RPU6_CHRLC|nr:GNAT family N-acetyltransferase [Chryseobacterium lactis]AZA84871.1 N-acetyltransferase [Chryseobacterium lactis]AZB05259.1 N-acetyltransferase [Chryseobacterium lactis]PNW12242.1 GNAT family N-acetyltransferase [Chryseobacterium lactis]